MKTYVVGIDILFLIFVNLSYKLKICIMRTRNMAMLFLVAGMISSFYSCSYKGECKCGSIIVEGEYDNKDEYDDAKAACQLLDCDWKKTL